MDIVHLDLVTMVKDVTRVDEAKHPLLSHVCALIESRWG